MSSLVVFSCYYKKNGDVHVTLAYTISGAQTKPSCRDLNSCCQLGWPLVIRACMISINRMCYLLLDFISTYIELFKYSVIGLSSQPGD